MSKILIASPGTGVFDDKLQDFRYRSVTYTAADSTSRTSEYLIEAMMALHHCDSVILVGSACSSWAAFYNYITRSDNKLISPAPARNDAYLARLRLEQLRSDNPERSPAEIRSLLAPLKQAMRRSCLDICVLRCGTSGAELTENFAILQALAGQLKDGDELVFDITDGERALPFCVLPALRCIREIRGLDIRLTAVTCSTTAPSGDGASVLDLLPLAGLSDAAKAVDEYNRLGTAHGLMCVLDGIDNKLLSDGDKNALRMLSGSVESCKLSDFHGFILHLHELLEAPAPDKGSPMAMLRDSALADIDRRFWTDGADAFEVYCRLAKWHCEKERYLAASIVLSETIISWCAGLCGVEITTLDDHQQFRFAMRKARHYLSDSYTGNFLSRYDTLRQVCSSLTHPIIDQSEQHQRNAQTLTQLAKEFTSTYVRHYKSSDENRKNLTSAILAAIDVVNKKTQKSSK